MTKAEEFEILLTRWEDDIRNQIRRLKRVSTEILYYNLKSGKPTFVVENTRTEVSGLLDGANLTMLGVWFKLYSRECPEYDGGDDVVKVIHKLSDEIHKWFIALTDISYDFKMGKIPIEELRTRIEEVSE